MQVLFVDRFGRRFMLIEGGIQCAIGQVCYAVLCCAPAA